MHYFAQLAETMFERQIIFLHGELLPPIYSRWTPSFLLVVFTSLRDGNRPHRIVGQPLVTANDVGHWDQKHPKVLIVGKKKREEFDSHV